MESTTHPADDANATADELIRRAQADREAARESRDWQTSRDDAGVRQEAA
ncbi:hypothetical protein ACIQMR_35485 [Streptomyces sp. NPDC091376]